ncbi:MAG: cell division protein DedD [Enterobacteriaceae bacterium]|jgi:DedD protein|nr:cell division protein DedD [Enterobacteriaceae bacterium]
MASQFQNRLVGAIIIVALGVIVLPSLFDGKKKHYEEEFAAIPLVPKEGDDQNTEILPSVNHDLPTVTNTAGRTETADNTQSAASSDTQTSTSPSVAPAATVPPVTTPPVTPPLVQSKPPVTKPDVKPETKPAIKPETKPEVKPETKPEIKTAEQKPEKSKEPPKEQAPVGQAYIVQLGALKNADKVNELVAMLSLSGYRVYTIPATPVQGKITRLVVGPEPSKQKLEAALPELHRLTGLSGQVKAYTTTR